MNLLDTNFDHLQNDRKLFDRVIRATQMDLGGVSYVDAYTALTEKGMQGARSEGRTTLAAALRWAGVDPDYIQQAVKTLEQRGRRGRLREGGQTRLAREDRRSRNGAAR